MSDRVVQMEKILKERGMEILFARVASNLMRKGNLDEAVQICENGLKNTLPMPMPILYLVPVI